MKNFNEKILHGTRVLAFNLRNYRDDENTPYYVTWCEGVILKRYGMISAYNFNWKYDDLVDIKFNNDYIISNAHFTEDVINLDVSYSEFLKNNKDRFNKEFINWIKKNFFKGE